MTDIAVISYHQSPQLRDAGAQNDIELVMDVTSKAMGKANVTIEDIDFICSGSCDYLGGAAFAFVNALDGLGVVPPKAESHVEMDAVWALYEAILKMKCGKADTALIYGFGKSSHAEMRFVPSLQLDPYYYLPLWPDTISLAGLQARALLDKGDVSEKDFAQIVVNSRKQAMKNPNAQLKGELSVEDVLSEAMLVDPLRKSDCCPVTDGASALVLATREKAEQLISEGKIKSAAYISGIDNRSDPHSLGLRDLASSESCRLAGEKAGVNKGPIDVAELYTPFSFQELIVKKALGLNREGLGEETEINPSGGTLAGHVFMSHGLERVGEVAQQIIDGKAQRGVAHATSGACLQQNLVAVLEA